MKSHLLITVALIVLLPSAFSQEQRLPPEITVSGSAEVKVTPDEVHIRAGVETVSDDLNEAKRQHDERMKSALGFLRAIGIPSKDIQTDFINVGTEYDGGWFRTNAPRYVVRKSIEIKLTSVTNLESTLTSLLTNGVNYIHGVDFRTTEFRKYRDQARAMAVRAAKEKAEDLARELGVKCGKPLSVNASDAGSGWWNWSGGYWGGSGFSNSQNGVQSVGGAPESGSDTLSIGQISVSANVNVSFQIQ